MTSVWLCSMTHTVWLILYDSYCMSHELILAKTDRYLRGVLAKLGWSLYIEMELSRHFSTLISFRQQITLFLDGILRATMSLRLFPWAWERKWHALKDNGQIDVRVRSWAVRNGAYRCNCWSVASKRGTVANVSMLIWEYLYFNHGHEREL